MRMKNFFMRDVSLTPAEPTDAAAVARLLSMAFGFDARRATEYIEHAGPGGFYAMRGPSGGLVACSALLMTSHSIGGSDVPAANIAHVAIAPEARGSGLARPLVEALCCEAGARGASMVSLFGSARPVYRKCGFELAGSEIVYEAETAALPSRTQVEFFAIEPGDLRLRSAYASKKKMEPGHLARAEVHWKELFRQPTDALAIYAAGDAKAFQAYVVIDASDPETLLVRDWHAAGGGMAEALLCFLGRFRSVYPKVSWHGGPDDELVAAMPDKGWRLAHQEEWLARILDPVAALGQRGYAVRQAAFNLRIVEPSHCVDIRVDLSNGRMKALASSADGLPVVTVEAPFFASLFTGFASASRLMRRGRLSGPPETVQTCDLVFAGPKPWVAEHF